MFKHELNRNKKPLNWINVNSMLQVLYGAFTEGNAGASEKLV